MSKCTLLVDMDGTICNWVKKLKEQFEAQFPDRKLLPLDQMTKFYVEDLHPTEWHDDIRKVVSTEGFYSSLEPLEGAIEALKDIEANCLGYLEPFICSSPEVSYDLHRCHSEKANWIDRHLGEFWTKRLILTKDKTLVRGHILIDDKPEIKGVMTPTWNHLPYAQPWNADKPVRFQWSEWATFRDGILAPNFGDKKGLSMESSGIIVVR